MINQLTLNPNGQVITSVKINGVLYLGGVFNSVNGQPRYNFAAVDLSTGDLLPFAPVFSSIIRSMAKCGDVLAIAGAFTSIDSLFKKFLVTYDPSTGEFTEVLSGAGYSFITNTVPSNIYSIVYHDATGVLYFNGIYVITNGTTTGGLLCGVQLGEATVKIFNLGFSFTNTIPSLSQTYGLALTIDQVNNRLYAGCGPNGFRTRSFNISDPDNVTAFSWAPIISPSQNFALFYIDSYVYVARQSGQVSLSVNGVVSGLMATDAVTGLNDLSQDIACYKQEFIGDTYVFDVKKLGDLLCVAGMFTNVKTSLIPRRSFAIFDSSNSYAVTGDNVVFSAFVTINYSSGPEQSNQPSLIRNIVFDDDKIHLFGIFRAVDGVVWNNGHYILSNQGKRIQSKYIF